MKNSEVIIVGGGVIGCAIAYNLAKMGIGALVIEKDEIGVGGSSRNGGGVRQSARDPRELPLAMYAVHNIWPTLSEELGVDVEYCQAGNLRLAKTDEHIKILQKIVDGGLAAGLELKLIEGDEVRQICPYISDDVIAASYCPTDGHGNPMKTTLAFYKRARELGTEFITGEEIKSLLIKRGKVAGVKTEKNIYEADMVLLACGLGSRAIANTAGIDLPMQKMLLEALITEAQPKMFPQMLGTAAADFYGHQTAHGSFVFGGSSGYENFEYEKSVTVTKSITASSICRAILGYFPCLAKANIIRCWAGFIDEMCDHIPVLGKVDEMPGLVLACGFSGHGYGISPAVGRAMAELVAGKETIVPLNAFRYDRFKPRI